MAAKFLFAKRIAATLAVVASSAFIATDAFAVGSSWVGGAGANNTTRRDWFNSTNWSGGVPGANGTAAFGSASQYIVNVNGSDTNVLSGLTVSNAAGSAYSFAGNNAIVVNGAIVNNKAGVKFNNLKFTGNSTLSGSGTTEIFLSAGAPANVTLTTTNHTVLVNGANVDVDMVVNNSGVLEATGLATIQSANIGALGALSGYGDGTNYFQGSFGDLNFSSGGASATAFIKSDSEYDAFTSNSATLNGALTIDLGANGGATYANYTTFGLFNSNALSGNFTSVSLANNVSPYNGLTFTADGAEWKTQAFTGAGGQQQWLVFQSTTGNLVVVPEPSTMVFAGVGVAMAGWSAWKKRRLASMLAKKVS